MYQLCIALYFIHSMNLIHCDIKPENLLVDKECNLKVCEFNLSRINNPHEPMAESVATRWYRAPELLLAFASYDFTADMWSADCVLADLILRHPFVTVCLAGSH
jgi:serine/threonine protein kinase